MSDKKKRKYKKPKLEKIKIDNDFSLILMTLPPTTDPWDF